MHAKDAIGTEQNETV